MNGAGRAAGRGGEGPETKGVTGYPTQRLPKEGNRLLGRVRACIPFHMVPRSKAESSVVDVFLACHGAVRRGDLIKRENRRDKEFHFQDWFSARLTECQLSFDAPGRNSYPDFRLVAQTDGYEVKGLAFPGREANYDCNSQVPTGHHNGREVFYVFGRYPSDAPNDEYAVVDLVICHGDFLNANHDYVHKNKNIKGFGTYGDIMIRDRKMYVAPTPYALTTGCAAQLTLILPEGRAADGRLRRVGTLRRVEAQTLIVGYSFDLSSNELTPERMPNPDAGSAHVFNAFRPTNDPGPEVVLVPGPQAVAQGSDVEDADE